MFVVNSIKGATFGECKRLLLLDSGTTNHSFCDMTFFVSGTYKEIPSFLETRSGEKLLSKELRSVLVTMKNKKSDKTDLILTNLRYSSSLRYNLTSTFRLSKEGIETFLQANEKPSQQIFNSKILHWADLIDKQYIICTYKERGIQALVTISHNDISIWNDRLGHLGYANMAKLLNLARELIFSGHSPDKICGP